MNRLAFENNPGVALTVCVGKWAGIYIKLSTTAFRVCLGFVAVTVWFCDVEKGWKNLSEYLKGK